MQKVLDLLESIKAGNANVLNISNETGIPSSRIYKWGSRKNSKISLEDALILEKWLNKLDNSTHRKLRKAPTDSDSSEIVEDVYTSISALREFVFEQVALARGVSISEIAADWGNKLTEVLNRRKDG